VGRGRLLIIDADLPKSLAGTLRKRARKAVSAAELGLAFNVKDPNLLRSLAELYDGKCDWTLVTGDDAMPAEHGPIIIETGATVATIHPEYPDDVIEHAWRVDVTQRWAHAMQEQQLSTVRRYSIGRSEPWKPRRRHIRTIAKEGLTPWRPEDAQRSVGADQDGAKSTDAAPLRLPGIE
jgi:hypothetical protein